MSDQFIGEIRIFGFPYAPRNWAQCNGQLLPISQNNALYALLGTYYGGDGRSTFALPNLQGNVALGQGQASGLSSYSFGNTGGSVTATLNASQLASHNHGLNADLGNVVTGTPTGNLYGKTANRLGKLYATAGNFVQMAGGVVGPGSGSGLPHPNQQPSLVVNYCIALTGVFPSRP